MGLAGRLSRFCHLCDKLALHVLDDRPIQLELVVEMVIKRALCDFRPPNDLIGARFGVTFLGEQLPGVGQQVAFSSPPPGRRVRA